MAVCIILVPLTTYDDPVTPIKSPDTASMQKSATTKAAVSSLVKDEPFDETSVDESPDEIRIPEEQPDAKVQLEAGTKNGSRDEYHTVFSTGCSTFQDWQSYVFFYHMLHSGQEGPVTRIASGCTDKDAKTLTEIFDTEIATMAPGRFRLHLTPDFSAVKPGKKFKYVSHDGRLCQHWWQAIPERKRSICSCPECLTVNLLLSHQ